MGRSTGILEPTKTDLTQEQVRQIFLYEPDTGILRWRKPRQGQSGRVAGGRHNKGYVQVSMGGRNYLAHRIIWLMHYGDHPEEIDHLNGVRDDNRIANLRASHRSANQQNAKLRSDNKAGIPGVNFSKPHGTWNARIQHNGVRHSLGYFFDIEDAIAARKAAQERLDFGPNCGAKQDETD